MGWSFDASTTPRDTSVPVEDEVAAFFASPRHRTWRHRLARLLGRGDRRRRQASSGSTED